MKCIHGSIIFPNLFVPTTFSHTLKQPLNQVDISINFVFWGVYQMTPYECVFADCGLLTSLVLLITH